MGLAKKALPSDKQIGKELESHGQVFFGKKAYNQSSDNCFEIASLLAERFGYFHPNSRGELRDKIFASRKRQIFGGDPSLSDKPTEACFVIRGTDNPDQIHVTFELFGKEFNYGYGTREEFPIERRIYLTKENRTKPLTDVEKSYISYSEDLKKGKRDVLEHSGNFFENIAKEAGFKGWSRENKDKFVPFGSFIKHEGASFPRRDKEMSPAKRNFLEKFGDIIKGIYEDRREIKSEEQSLQELAKKLTFQLVDFWKAPDYMKSYVPTVMVLNNEKYKAFTNRQDADIDLEVPHMAHIMTSLGNMQIYKIIINENWLAKSTDDEAFNIKSSIAEEVGHFIQYSINPSAEKDRDVDEFFGMISRLHITEQSPEIFKDFYNGIFLKAQKFSNDKEQLTKLLNGIYDMEAKVNGYKSKGGIIPDNILNNLRQLEAYKIDASHKLAHLAYFPAAAWYFEIKKMKPDERYALLKKSSAEIRRTVMGDAEKKLLEITKNMGSGAGVGATTALAISGPRQIVPVAGAIPAQELMKQQWDRQVQIDMQGFVVQLSYKLVDWWGMPRSQIEGKIPRIEIIPDDLFENRMVSTDRLPEFKNSGAFYSHNENKIYFSDRFMKSPYGFEGWKAVLGEEVGHFVTDTILIPNGSNAQMKEFFGGLCKYLVADFSTGSFKKDYMLLVREASNFKKDLDFLNKRKSDLWNDMAHLPLKDGHFDKEGFDKIKKEFESVKDHLDHVLQKPAAFYLFKIKNMTPQERYRLLTDGEYARNLILEFIGKEGKNGEVDKLRQKITERIIRSVRFDIEELKNQYLDNSLENSGHFFGATAAAAGLEEYGRGAKNLKYPLAIAPSRQLAVVSDEQLKKEEDQEVKNAENQIEKGDKKYDEQEEQMLKEMMTEEEKDEKRFAKEEEAEVDRELSK